MVGVVIRKAVDEMEEHDLTDEEKRIDREIDNLKMSRTISFLVQGQLKEDRRSECL